MSQEDPGDFGLDGGDMQGEAPLDDDADELDDSAAPGRRSRKRSLRKRIRRFFRRQVSRVRKLALCSEGFSLKGAQTWIRRTNRDRRRGDYSKSEIKAAHDAGFSAAQVERFGIDLGRAQESLSEREYDLLYPMSGRYSKWIDDRVTARIVAGPYARCLEPQHVNIISRNGALLFIPLSSEARAFKPELLAAGTEELGIEWFLRFVRAHAGEGLRISGSAWKSSVSLPIRPVAGGFAFKSGLADDEMLIRRIRRRARKTPLVLLEEAPQDASWAEMPEGRRSSVRLIVCNPTGTDPQVVDASLMVLARRRSASPGEAAQQEEPPSGPDGVEPPSAVLQSQGQQPAAAAAEDAESDDEEVEELAVEWVLEELQPAGQEGADAEDDQAPAVWFYCAPIDLATGSFDGARAMYSRGRFADTPVDLRTGAPIAGTVAHWAQIVRDAEGLFARIPQVEFAELAVRSSAEGYRIVSLNSFPTFNRAYPLPEGVQRYLKQRAADKRELSRSQARQRVNHAAFLRLRRAYTKVFWPKGMVFYQGIRYPQDVVADLFSRNGVPLGKKLWTLRHGFLSYRLELYPELGPDNWQEFVTDVEYRWLRHINPKYRTWMEDKITYKYLLAGHAEHLPAYYFYTSCRAGQNRFLPMMDCPAGFEASVEGILRLAREVGELALKPDEGSHGEGFYRLSYEAAPAGTPEGPAAGAPVAAGATAAGAAGPAPDAAGGRYLLSGVPATAAEVAAILQDPDNQYLVTECIATHPDLARIYPGAVGTVRVTVFKRDGVNPQIGNAYLRIGSSETGGVDNVVAGGFVAEVDVETGAFGRARTLRDNRIVYVDVHPDTGERMEGVLPHWDYVRREVLAMAADIPQLEYLGFDVAITLDGFKLLEVNRYPDYPRIARLTPETTGYLLMKIDDKYRALNIEHDRSLFKLPRRDNRGAGAPCADGAEGPR